MAQVIISENDQGGVSITTPSSEFTVSEILDKEDFGRFARIVDESELPEHKEFFDAWEINENSITVNLSKAKEITKNRLRSQREPLLAAQDVAYMKALESSSDTKEIIAEKNRLRDITKLVDKAKTLENLLSISC